MIFSVFLQQMVNLITFTPTYRFKYASLSQSGIASFVKATSFVKQKHRGELYSNRSCIYATSAIELKKKSFNITEVLYICLISGLAWSRGLTP